MAGKKDRERADSCLLEKRFGCVGQMATKFFHVFFTALLHFFQRIKTDVDIRIDAEAVGKFVDGFIDENTHGPALCYVGRHFLHKAPLDHAVDHDHGVATGKFIGNGKVVNGYAKYDLVVVAVELLIQEVAFYFPIEPAGKGTEHGKAKICFRIDDDGIAVTVTDVFFQIGMGGQLYCEILHA